MISYKRTRLKGSQTRQQLAQAQAQLNQLKIENQALKTRLDTQQASLSGTTGFSSPENPAGLQFEHNEEGMLGYFLDYSSTLAFINTTEGQYQYANDAFARYLGTTPEN